jgi:hypothetical protein
MRPPFDNRSIFCIFLLRVALEGADENCVAADGIIAMRCTKNDIVVDERSSTAIPLD